MQDDWDDETDPPWLKQQNIANSKITPRKRTMYSYFIFSQVVSKFAVLVENNLDKPKMVWINPSAKVSLRFGAGGYLDLAPGQSLSKALKF